MRIRVHPGARRTGLVGWLADGTLKLEVQAAPERGRGNAEVERLLARVLGVPAGRVSVVTGATGRSKQVAIEGIAEPEARRRIDRALGEAS